MQPFVYIIHFDKPMSHAQHYIGCTEDIFGRLTTHSIGYGANILRAAICTGIEWRLGGLHKAPSRERLREIERSTKTQHNAQRYCQLCNPETARIPECTPYPLETIPWEATSSALRQYQRPLDLPAQWTVQISCEGTARQDIAAVASIMRLNREALGFIPASGTSGISSAADSGRIWTTHHDGRCVAYMLWSEGAAGIRINQICVKDAVRGAGIGRALIESLQNLARNKGVSLTACVRSDLPANEFWLRMGFAQIGAKKHPTSGSTLNTFYWSAINAVRNG